ncbi:hypothetical protein D3C75_472040 [compost metagenome]
MAQCNFVYDPKVPRVRCICSGQWICSRQIRVTVVIADNKTGRCCPYRIGHIDDTVGIWISAPVMNPVTIQIAECRQCQQRVFIRVDHDHGILHRIIAKYIGHQRDNLSRLNGHVINRGQDSFALTRLKSNGASRASGQHGLEVRIDRFFTRSCRILTRSAKSGVLCRNIGRIDVIIGCDDVHLLIG